ncbi:DNA repair exonuclease [Bacillus coahuilensis m2-6]|uniref:exonuclease SbcCD subunit D n=1 Tax=Bacillus coahuilensis TaxID=408580 RepID=UPI0007501E13|nr:exonuclease SbcCD subunit D [Bacillus coahuilensis]KUP08391.1 DNA repair exonuclease [Bacillus coahuilensis m2-6]
MKIIHTADWHLGKLIHGLYMTEDQKIVLHQLVDLVEEEQPDAVIVAGDLYDRSVPPTAAVDLLDEIFYKINVELQTPIVAISGNHDSAERLHFGSSWYKKNHLYLQGKLNPSFEPIRIKGVNFYTIPYAEPGLVRQLLQDESISTHHDAMKAISGRIEEKMNRNEPNVLIGHHFVLGGKETDSERVLSVGGSSCVGQEVFAPFTYTALGHLHSPDAIKHPSIKYSGSLLKYSFSEASQRKSVSIVTIEKGSISIEERELKPLKDMRVIEGFLEELLEPSFYQSQQVEDYLKISLLDEGAIIDPINQLRKVYPNVLHLERRIDRLDIKRNNEVGTLKNKKKTELDLFEEFYSSMTSSEFTTEKREYIQHIMNQVKLGAEE